MTTSNRVSCQVSVGLIVYSSLISAQYLAEAKKLSGRCQLDLLLAASVVFRSLFFVSLDYRHNLFTAILHLLQHYLQTQIIIAYSIIPIDYNKTPHVKERSSNDNSN
jgi:hypothetical protein